MRYAFAFLPLALVSAAPAVFQVDTIHKDAAPILSTSHAEEVPNSYMIVFKKDVKDHKKHTEWVQTMHEDRETERMELRKRSQLPLMDEVFEGLKHTFDISGLAGYSGHFDDETIEQIRRHPDVSSRHCPPTFLSSRGPRGCSCMRART